MQLFTSPQLREYANVTAQKAAEWRDVATRTAGDAAGAWMQKCQKFIRNVKVHHLDDIDEDDLQTLTYIAPLDERIKDIDNIFKLCQEGWQGRHFVVTKSNIFLTHLSVEMVSEKIPLHEIAAIKPYDDSEEHQLEAVEGDMDFAFVLETIQGGYTGGKEYCFRAENQESCDELMLLLKQLSEVCAKEVAFQTRVEARKEQARLLIQSNSWQAAVSLLIATNFAINLAQSSAAPQEGSTAAHFFAGLDISFTTIFAVELVINLFGNWFWPFFRDGWSVFDLIVVTVSLASLLFPQAPGISILRLMRTFRVLRLFKKLRSLRTIMNSLAFSMYPVFNAFLIVGLVLFVYAILGVQLYSEISPDLFGTFAASVWTMFRVSTYDGWGDIFEAISYHDHPRRFGPDASPAFFMGSFIAVMCWVLQPLVMAVMFDNFSEAVKVEKHKAIMEAEEKARRKAQAMKPDTPNGSSRGQQSQRQLQGSPLTPLLESLSRFKDADDLSRRIQDVFKMLDVDLGGTISFDEMKEGLRKMDFKPPIELTGDYFSVLTRRGALCDAAGNLNPQNFEIMLYSEVQQYTYEKVARAFEDNTIRAGTPENGAILASLKWLMMREETSSFSSSASSKSKRKAFDIQDFIDCCRKFAIWQDEVKHVRDVEFQLRKDLESMRAANLDLNNMMKKELHDISRDMLSLRQDMHLHLKRSELHHRYVSTPAKETAIKGEVVEECVVEELNQHVVRS